MRPDGYTYTPYTWTYTGAIDPSNTETGSDGVERVWLGHFNVQATIRQDNNSSANLTYWAERSITLVRDGEEEELTFQRRAGARGYLAGPGARTASKSAKSAATEPPVPESTDEPTEETVEVELPTAIL